MRNFNRFFLVIICWLCVAQFAFAVDIGRNVPIVLTEAKPIITTPTVTVDQLTSNISLVVKRPTTLNPLAWDAASTMRIRIVFIIDGVEYPCTGQVSGGIRTRPSDGAEASEYRLACNPTVLLGQRARDYMAVNEPDAEGFYNDVPLTRIGELGTTIQAYAQFIRLSGAIVTELSVASTQSAPAPKIRTKNSVAFDASTSAQELNGDGILSLTHTSTGTNRGAFAGVGWFQNGASSTTTYGAAGMAEQWDFAASADWHNAGYTVAGQATGAQTVTNTLASAPNGDHGLGVISMTGVDQTTPVGTSVTGSGNSASASVTVGSVGSQDLVVDNLYLDFGDGNPWAVGADQTSRYSQTMAWVGSHVQGSTQPGTAGGVMSWSGSSRVWALGAIAFKPVAAATCLHRLNLLGAGC